MSKIIDFSQPPNLPHLEEQVQQFWQENGFDQSTRSIFFSDSLDDSKALAIQVFCQEKGIASAYGIGTFLTHTLTGHPGANIVIKLTRFDGIDVCKLSDISEKRSGKSEAIAQALNELQIV